MNRVVVIEEAPEPQTKKEKPKLSLTESFRTLIKSKHLGFIALLVICYGISQNVIEAVWKGQIKLVYGNENEYNAFMGRFSMMTGFLTICFMLIGSNIVRLFGWLVSASLTPLMIFLTGIFFFSFVYFRHELEPTTLLLVGLTPTALSVWLGLFQNILSKATKYSLFDPTKEMCYIPLDKESKVKGKAAVDVVGGRLGKSGGSFIQQFLLVLTGSSLIDLSPYFGGVVVVIVAIWLLANRGLNRSLKEKEQAKEAVAELV
jgi:AAA family ATP:ADP antiporter